MTTFVSMLSTLAYGLGIWFLVSVVAAVVVSLWFRRQARANELLSLDARRREFLEAATTEETIKS